MTLVVLKVVIGAPTKLLNSFYLSSCKGSHIFIPHFGLREKLTSLQVFLYLFSPVIADIIFLSRCILWKGLERIILNKLKDILTYRTARMFVYMIKK